MAGRMGALYPNWFCGVAIIGGSFSVTSVDGGVVATPDLHGSMPVLIVNGTSDHLRPYLGGESATGSILSSARESALHWVRGNNLTPIGAIQMHEPVTVQGADSSVVVEAYQKGPGRGEVVFVTINDGEHRWPSWKHNVGFDGDAFLADFLARQRNRLCERELRRWRGR